jgi:hypothetical protein
MSSLRASFARTESRSGKLASFLITAVALAIALGSSTAALAGDSSLHSPATQPLQAAQDDALTQDSDDDGLADRVEIQQYRTNPLHPDSDRDGVSDGDEATIYRSNPLNADTDGDGLVDGDEVRFGTDLLLTDTDGDGLADGEEIAVDADAFSADSDGDGIADSVEVIQLGTSPASTDSDGDGLLDGDEVSIHNTNPTRADALQLFTYAPVGNEDRVPTRFAAPDGHQPLQVADVTTRTTVSRIPLAPARYTPVLQALD